MITVIGHDGSPLRPEATTALARAGLVAGGARHLAAVDVPPHAETVVMGEVGAALDRVASYAGDVVVLASGDPLFFGVVRALRERPGVPARLRVVPAVSSVAQAFARVALPWDDALVVSAHGRALAPAVHVCRSHPKVAVLTAPGAGPAELGAALAGPSVAVARRLVVAQRLGEPDEDVVECTPAEAAARQWREPNVVLCLDPAAPAPPRGWLSPRPAVPGGWALPEGEFDHRDSMVTKAEVRAVALARLAPAPGVHVWDVGSGSGSVAVECARFGAAVTAVERDPEQCERTARNARRHGVAVAVVRGEAPAALHDLPAPDAVFVGGGSAVLPEVLVRRPRRVVVSLAALERVGPAVSALADAGYATDGVLLQASRLAALPGGTHRLAATNPVVLVWGELA